MSFTEPNPPWDGYFDTNGSVNWSFPKGISHVCEYEGWCPKPSFGGTYCLKHLHYVCTNSIQGRYGDTEWAAKQLEIIRSYLRDHPEEALEL